MIKSSKKSAENGYLPFDKHLQSAITIIILHLQSAVELGHYRMKINFIDSLHSFFHLFSSRFIKLFIGVYVLKWNYTLNSFPKVYF